VTIVRNELQGRIDEINQWSPVSATTDFPSENDLT
jgi:hypothetical protein